MHGHIGDDGYFHLRIDILRSYLKNICNVKSNNYYIEIEYQNYAEQFVVYLSKGESDIFIITYKKYNDYCLLIKRKKKLNKILKNG